MSRQRSRPSNSTCQSSAVIYVATLEQPPRGDLLPPIDGTQMPGFRHKRDGWGINGINGMGSTYPSSVSISSWNQVGFFLFLFLFHLDHLEQIIGEWSNIFLGHGSFSCAPSSQFKLIELIELIEAIRLLVGSRLRSGAGGAVANGSMLGWVRFFF